MLDELKEKHIPILYNELQNLSDEDNAFFHPHLFDKKTLESLLKDNEKYYIFYYEGELIGYCFIRTFGKFEIPTLGCIIWGRYREKGYGEILMKELEEETKKLGFKSLMLKVYNKNKIGIKLYKKCGFKKISKEGIRIWMIKHL